MDVLIFLAMVGLPLFLPLVVTIVVEWAAGWAIGLRGPRSRRTLVWMNVATNPLLVLLLLLVFRFAGAAYWTFTGVFEFAVIVVEWLILRWALGLRPGRAAWSSAVLNGSSFLAGLALLELRI